MIAAQFIAEGNGVGVVLAVTGLTRNAYYYKKSDKPKGKKRSTHTRKTDDNVFQTAKWLSASRASLKKSSLTTATLK